MSDHRSQHDAVPNRDGTVGIATTNDQRAGVEIGTGDALRAAMRNTAATIAVVTAQGQAEKRGITVSTFNAISLEPAIISFAIERHSRMRDVLATAKVFYVHILNEHQDFIARRFGMRSRSGAEQFDGLDTDDGPRLPTALSVIACLPHAKVEAGDHDIVLGKVIRVEMADTGSPLLYHNRSYRRIGGIVE